MDDDLIAEGETFIHNGLTYYVGWMECKDGDNAYSMWLNEQPNGGFKWQFLDYKPSDEENYRKIYILANDPRAASGEGDVE